MQYILTEKEINNGFEIEKKGETEFMKDYAAKVLQESLHNDGFLTELQYENKNSLTEERCKIIIYKRIKKDN